MATTTTVVYSQSLLSKIAAKRADLHKRFVENAFSDLHTALSAERSKKGTSFCVKYIW